MVSGSSVVEFGTRNLTLHSPVSHRTVSRVLRMLRDEPDPLVDLVSLGGRSIRGATGVGQRPRWGSRRACHRVRASGKTRV